MTTPITTVAAFKAYAGITGSNQDALIASMIDPCLKAIGNFCNRNFASRTITELRDGNNASRMMLANYPITQITSVIIDDIILSASDYIAPLGSRTLVLKDRKFTRGMLNVQITLLAGYGDASGVAGVDINPWPSDLVLAQHLYMLIRIRERERIGAASKSLAGESISYDDGSGSVPGIPKAAVTILDNYLNTVPESGT